MYREYEVVMRIDGRVASFKKIFERNCFAEIMGIICANETVMIREKPSICQLNEELC